MYIVCCTDIVHCTMTKSQYTLACIKTTFCNFIYKTYTKTLLHASFSSNRLDQTLNSLFWATFGMGDTSATLIDKRHLASNNKLVTTHSTHHPLTVIVGWLYERSVSISDTPFHPSSTFSLMFVDLSK